MIGMPGPEQIEKRQVAGAKPMNWLVMVLAAGAFIVLCALGTWQWNRLVWKEALIATIEARIAEKPVTLDAIIGMADSGQDIEYRPVRLTGRTLPGKEQFVLATLDGASGWHVYTPVEVEGGEILFVNRGFVPFDRRDPASRPDGQMDGLVNIEGLAREALTEKPSRLVPDNDPAAGTYYWKDIAAMTVAAGVDEGKVLPFFVDKTSMLPGGMLPIANVTQVKLPNNHLQYLITWYGLAAALAAVALAYWLKSRRALA
jgi:surfeit locus 1 family protein